MSNEEFYAKVPSTIHVDTRLVCSPPACLEKADGQQWNGHSHAALLQVHEKHASEHREIWHKLQA
jgi:hypothetical protein